MYRFRFRIRSGLIVIAILCVALAGIIESVRLKRRRDRCQRLAFVHAQIEAVVRDSQRMHESLAAASEHVAARFESWPKRGLTGSDFYRREAEKQRNEAKSERAEAARAGARADFHSALTKKYQRAASRPWAAVDADPAPPPQP
jgi:hypothetical protein